jgi:hypothetical protein
MVWQKTMDKTIMTGLHMVLRKSQQRRRPIFDSIHRMSRNNQQNRPDGRLGRRWSPLIITGRWEEGLWRQRCCPRISWVSFDSDVISSSGSGSGRGCSKTLKSVPPCPFPCGHTGSCPALPNIVCISRIRAARESRVSVTPEPYDAPIVPPAVLALLRVVHAFRNGLLARSWQATAWAALLLVVALLAQHASASISSCRIGKRSPIVRFEALHHAALRLSACFINRVTHLRRRF